MGVSCRKGNSMRCKEQCFHCEDGESPERWEHCFSLRYSTLSWTRYLPAWILMEFCKWLWNKTEGIACTRRDQFESSMCGLLICLWNNSTPFQQLLADRWPRAKAAASPTWNTCFSTWTAWSSQIPLRAARLLSSPGANPNRLHCWRKLEESRRRQSIFI